MADDFGVFDEAFAEDIVSLAFAIGIPALSVRREATSPLFFKGP